MISADRIAHIILRRNLPLLIGLALVLAVLAAGLPRLSFSTDNRAFFGRDNLEFRDLLLLEQTYASTDALLFLAVPPAGSAFGPESLTALRRLTEDAWQIPFVLRVDSAANHSVARAEGDEIFIEPLLPPEGDVTAADAARFRDIAPGLEELAGRYLSEAGDAYGIGVQVVLPDGDAAARAELMAHLQVMLADWRADLPGWEFRATGGILGGMALAQVAWDDLFKLVPLAFLAVLALLVFMVRSLRGAMATMAVVGAGTVATLGIAGWTGVVLTAGTAISPLSVMVLITASCIHVLLSWIRAQDGPAPERAAETALAENLGAVTVTNLTTALGFLCLNFSHAPPLREMGNIIAFGLMVGLAATFLVLPAMLRGDRRRGRRTPITPAMMDRVADVVLRRHRLWLLGFPVLVAVALTGVLRIGFDDSIFRYFDQRYEFRRDSDVIRDRLSGLESLQFSFRAPEDTTVFDPDFLRRLDRFAGWLRDQPGVISVASVTDVLKRLNKSMNGDDPAFARIADSREANAQLMMLYEFSLPVGMDLTTTIDVTQRQTRLFAALRADDAEQVRKLAAAAEAWLAGNEPGLSTRASGMSVAFSRLSERNNRQMLAGLAAVLVLVSATMIAALRSRALGAISLAPNVVPALLAFGLWGYTFGNVNLGSTVVTTMTFGIVVDDTVHFLMHYQRRRRAGLGAEAAMRDTFSVVGAAIIITSLALMAGFAVMAFSGFVINQHIGALTVFVVGFALLADLLFLPALLMRFRGAQ